MSTSLIQTNTVEIILREDGVAEFVARQDMVREFTVEDIVEIEDASTAFKESHRLYLVHINNGKYSQEARKKLANQNNVADKIAMVANRPFQRLVGNFFLGLNRPKIAIKLFTDVQKAEEWLLNGITR